MPSRRTHLVLVAALVAFARPAAAQEREPARSAAAREGLEAIEAQLARAVDRVSLPHGARLLGRVESARGYRLPGYGIVLVLTPRMLPGGEQIQTFERQVLVLQHETEAARRAAEEEMERLVEDVRVRVAPPSEVRIEVHTVAPEASEPPAPPQAPDAPALPLPAPPPPPPAPPPWKFWFETGTLEEKRTPEAVVADVRGAVIDALAAQGERLAGLAGDERITVAVDFVPGGLFAAHARPEKTLVMTARVKDVADRTRGAITLEELRKRVEVTEY